MKKAEECPDGRRKSNEYSSAVYYGFRLLHNHQPVVKRHIDSARFCQGWRFRFCGQNYLSSRRSCEAIFSEVGATHNTDIEKVLSLGASVLLFNRDRPRHYQF